MKRTFEKKSTHPIAEARIAKQRAADKAAKAKNAAAKVKAAKEKADKAMSTAKERRRRSRKSKKPRLPIMPKVDHIYPGMEVTGVVTRWVEGCFTLKTSETWPSITIILVTEWVSYMHR